MYAILSHRWEDGEVSFQDIQDPLVASQKPQWSKVKNFCEMALFYGYDWAWVDTCCIDKTSSSELSEAINSMYRWYENAGLCIVYMSDVRVEREMPGLLGREKVTLEGPLSVSKNFAESQWFKRGWTLQELIAPAVLAFYDSEWGVIGSKESLIDFIHEITGVDLDILRGADPASVSVAKRISWASQRETTREEDRAYCLLGLFDVHMPMLYGEGNKAFVRLQEEIMKYSDDESLFAWTIADGIECEGLLASSPSAFASCSSIFEPSRSGHEYAMTNKGMKITLRMIPWDMDMYLGLLKCKIGNDTERQTGIFLRDLKDGNQDRFVRGLVEGQSRKIIEPYPTHMTSAEERSLAKAEEKTIYIPHRLTPRDIPGQRFMYGFSIRKLDRVSVSMVYPKERWHETGWDSNRRRLTMPPGPHVVTGVLLCSGYWATTFFVVLGFRKGFQPFVYLQPAHITDSISQVYESVPEFEPKREAQIVVNDTHGRYARTVIHEEGNQYAVDIGMI